VVAVAARPALLLGAVAVLALGSPPSLPAQEDEVGLPIGAAAPAAVVQDLDGRPVNLADVVGKRPVLMEFWATWCPICAALMPRIEAAHARYGDRVDFVEVAVGVNETRSSVRRHVAEHHYPFRFFWDATGAAVRAYRAPTTSYVVVLNAAGHVVYTGTGSDQDIDAAIRRATGG
jgi:cytochrome c biogenesis protein CcmG/thiol:disulfide interchange protein DsbE